MSKFIVSRSGVQCRSHHQKYEIKYKFPHRIIKKEKKELNPYLYEKMRGELELIAFSDPFSE